MKKTCMLFYFLGFSIFTLAQETYKISSESKLLIEGTSTVHSWMVSANKLDGSLTLEGQLPTAINFEVLVSDIHSERGATMDKKMYAALKKEEHPKVLFVLEQFKNESTLLGTLKIAGAEQEVEIDSKISFYDDIMKIVGKQKIVLKDFEIEPPTAMFGQIIVGDEVTVKFDLIFEKE